MSKPRYDWWSYAKGIVRRYPALKAEYNNIHDQTITQQYSGMPGGGGDGRIIERLAIRELPKIAMKEYNAVTEAEQMTRKVPTGADRMMVIELVFWRKTHTLEGASQVIHCHYKTAQEYAREFIYLVAEKMELYERDSTRAKNK